MSSCRENDFIPVGATPTHIFDVDVDLTDLTDIQISYYQSDTVRIRKRLSDGDVEITSREEQIGETAKTIYSVTTELTEQDTMQLDENEPVWIQLRCKFVNGRKMISEVIETVAGELLDKEEF